MCGIIGHFQQKLPIAVQEFQNKLKQLAHRGPDGQGIWLSSNNSYALGHTRLAFLDLTEKGKQPFVSADQKVVLTFNGEIYNFKALRQQLAPFYEFKSETDTEVVLAAYLVWGKNCVKQFEGMFAFCILDLEQQIAFLARDPFGIKPLYYTLAGQMFLFASELKGIIPTEGLQVKLNHSALIDYFVYRYVPSPNTIWDGIYKLAPAQLAILDLSTFQLQTETYWDPIANKHFKDHPFDHSTFEKEFQHDVQQHLLADVPIGGFLSGGYDSSALALAAHQAQHDYATFTVGFKEWAQSEEVAAGAVAKQLGQVHHKLELDASSLNLLDQMPVVYDEPIADISIIPTCAVSRLAAKHRKAVLSGEGADELFLGYHWQKEWLSIQQQQHRWFQFFKPKVDIVAFYSNAMSMGVFDRHVLTEALTEEWQRFIPQDLSWFYRSQLSRCKDPVRQIQYLDQKCFMGELVLTKIDRASMANSLEVRVPFLNKRTFEQIHSSDLDTYVQKGVSKFPIYAYLRKSFSKTHLNRQKQGFVGPDSYYMDKDFYQSALGQSYLVADGIIRKEFITKELAENYTWRLWKLVVLEKWYAHWRQFITH